jgi:hypothetical protein
MNHAESFLDSKTIIRIMQGLSPRTSCRGGIKKLDILTVRSLYIFALIMFVVNNLGSYQATSPRTRQKNQLYLPLVKFSSIQKGVIYSSIKIYNNLQPNVLKHHDDIMAFKSIKLLINIWLLFLTVIFYITITFLFLSCI